MSTSNPSCSTPPGAAHLRSTTMQIIPYLGFRGECREAFAFYAQALGGEIVATMTYAESPMADQVPAETRHYVMHAHIVAEGANLMGADGPWNEDDSGSQTCINVMVDDNAKAERIFNALAEGGQITMPMAETFWSHRFGMLTDRYGKPWMVNHLKDG
jgi:PhnB protein